MESSFLAEQVSTQRSTRQCGLVLKLMNHRQTSLGVDVST